MKPNPLNIGNFLGIGAVLAIQRTRIGGSKECKSHKPKGNLAYTFARLKPQRRANMAVGRSLRPTLGHSGRAGSPVHAMAPPTPLKPIWACIGLGHQVGWSVPTMNQPLGWLARLPNNVVWLRARLERLLAEPMAQPRAPLAYAHVQKCMCLGFVHVGPTQCLIGLQTWIQGPRPDPLAPKF